MKTQSQSAREKILRAASEVIVEHGLIGMTLNLVAHRAGVSKGALFHYFENKHALIEELFDEFLRAFEADLKSAMDRDQVPQGKFFRAYALATITPRNGADEIKLIDACVLAMYNDKYFSNLWYTWLLNSLKEYDWYSNMAMAHFVRYADDGILLARNTESTKLSSEEYQFIFSTIIDTTDKL